MSEKRSKEFDPNIIDAEYRDSIIESFRDAWLYVNHVEKECGRPYFEGMEDEYERRKSVSDS